MNNETTKSLITQHLGLLPYEHCYQLMQNTVLERIDQKKRQNSTADELWFVQHPSTYTLGQAGDPVHILNAKNIPVVKTDRGGQVTWHGKGQIIGYFLFDLLSLNCNVRQLVTMAEDSICDLLQPYLNDNLVIKARKDAPGVYIYQLNDKNEETLVGKIASLGFKIKRGFSYHGIAININADLTPFENINPCGYKDMRMVNLLDVARASSPLPNIHELEKQLEHIITQKHADFVKEVELTKKNK